MSRGLFIAIGLLIGLGAGLVAGAWFAGGSSSADQDLLISAPSRSGPAVSPSSAPGASTPIKTAHYAATAEAMIADLGDAPTATPAEGATETITGTVLTERGQPLANVLLRATQNSDDEEAGPGRRPGDAPLPNSDLRSKVQRWLDDEGRRMARQREVRTDANGAYSFATQAGGTYSLEAFAEGFEVRPVVSQHAWRVRSGSQADFVAVSLLRVKADVRLPDGSRPARAKISPAQGGWRYGRSYDGGGQDWTPEEPEIRLAPGVHQLVAVAGKKNEYRSPTVHAFVDLARPPETIVFEATGITGVHGRILPPPDQEGGNYSVHLLSCDGGAAADDQRLISNGRSQWFQGESAPEYEFSDLTPGTWRIGLQADNRGLVYSEVLTIVEGIYLEKDLSVPASLDASGVVVRVVGPEGHLVRNAQVWVNSSVRQNFRSSKLNWDRGGSSTAGPTWNVRRGKDGTWLAQRSATGSPDAPPALLYASVSNFGSRAVPLPPSGTGELEIRLEPPGLLEVKLPPAPTTDAKRRTSQGVMLRQRDPRVSQPGFVDLPFDNTVWTQDGRATFGPLQPGAYEVTMAWKGRWAAPEAQVATPVEIRPGLNTLVVTPPPLHKLVVDVGTSSGINRVGIGFGDDDGSSGFDSQSPDTSGLVTFDGLIAGDYKLTASGRDGNQSMSVRVPAPAVLRFDPVRERALRVRKADDGGYLAEAGFRVGDVIIGVNGEMFDGEKPASTVLNGLMMARKENSLIVNREGKTFEIKVDAGRFSSEHQRAKALEALAR